MQTAPPIIQPAAPSVVPAGTQSSGTVSTAAKPVEVVQPVASVRQVRPQGRDLEQTLDDVAEYLRNYLKANSRELEFRVDADHGKTVILVRDASGAIVRQIPGEEALKLQERLSASSGTFLDTFI